MPKRQNATTMSVPEMRMMLGLKKTESYWLLKKGYFQTTTVAGQIRIDRNSFEEWYANQDHYRKVDGPEPGKSLREESYSIADICKLLAITRHSARDMIERYHIASVMEGHQMRVLRKSFDPWLGKQSHYRTPEQREQDRAAEEASLSLPEMGRMLGLSREGAYALIKSHGHEMEVITIAGRKRVTIESFWIWYHQQDKYQLLKEKTVSTNVPSNANAEQKLKTLYTVQEAAEYLGINVKEVYRMIDAQLLYAIKVKSSLRVRLEDLSARLTQQEEEG